MKTIKPGKISVLTRTFERDGACHLAVTPLVHFAFSETRSLLSEQEMWKFVPAELGEQVLDLGMPKVRGEVIVWGRAHPRQPPRSVCAVRVAIGTVDKTLDVVGDRIWRRGVPTDPEPFAEMPLTYARAFGGEGYPQNPVGKGFAPGPDKVQPLPNVELPGRLVRSPRERPAPAGFAPYDLAWPQRSAKAGTFDRKWQRAGCPEFAPDMDWALFNAAPDDQQIQGYFAGDEAFVLENMHPSLHRLEGRLPGIRARAFVTLRDAPGLHEVSTRLDTVWLFPHAERGVLAFRGLTRVAEDDAADVRQLLLGCEALGEPRSEEHYAAVLALRLDKKKGAMAALRDRDLMPVSEPGPGRPPPRVPTAARRQQARRRLEAEHPRVVADMKARGLDTASIPPLPQAADYAPPDMDDVGEYLEDQRSTAERIKAEALADAKTAEDRAREECAKQGVDYDERAKEATSQGGGPPRFSAMAEMEKLRGLATMAATGGTDLPEVTALLSDPGLEQKLVRAEGAIRDAYRKHAHRMPPAPLLDSEASALIRAEVARAVAARESLAGRDLTGADLSGVNLTGADLRGALMERTHLVGSELGGADLSGAVLARADLTRANLFGAKLAGANLGGATLVDAELGWADMSRAVLGNADLTRARLHKARAEGIDLTGATLRDSDWSGAALPKTRLLKLDLGGMKLVGAELSKTMFLECALDGTDLSEAQLTGVSFIRARGEATCFRRARLDGASFAGESAFPRAAFDAASLRGANLRGVDLAGATFERAELGAADVSETNLRGANLHLTRAREARFVRSDLTEARMERIDLLGGSLAKATLHGTDLRGANLFGVDLRKAHLDTATRVAGANLARTQRTPAKE